MRFCKPDWENDGNCHHLVGTEINVYQWNAGCKANFLLTAGYRYSNHKEITIPGAGSIARDTAIRTAIEMGGSYKARG